MGHNMHALQREILIKGLSLLKVGGRLTYSTCSFNPIENEAVVVSALEHFKGKVKIVDVKSEVSKDLKYRPGVLRWKVYHKAKGKMFPAEWYSSFDNVPE